MIPIKSLHPQLSLAKLSEKERAHAPKRDFPPKKSLSDSELGESLQEFMKQFLQRQKEETQEELAVAPPAVSSLTLSNMTIAANRQAMQISAEWTALVEKMVGEILTIHRNGIQQTTFTLNSPQFASSKFFGLQISILEYSTAPKIFNVELIASMDPLRTIQANLPNLLSQINDSKLPFKVGRIDLHLLNENEREKPEDEQQ